MCLPYNSDRRYVYSRRVYSHTSLVGYPPISSFSSRQGSRHSCSICFPSPKAWRILVSLSQSLMGTLAYLHPQIPADGSSSILTARAITVPRSPAAPDLHSRQQTHFVVQGVLGSNTTPSRREINDLIKDEAQFSLYIQALGTFSVNYRLLNTLTPVHQPRCKPKTNKANFPTFKSRASTVSLSSNGPVPALPHRVSTVVGAATARTATYCSRHGIAPTA